MNLPQVFLILIFGLSGAVCLAMTQRVSRVPSADVRRGLLGLFLFSGLWAISELSLLLLSSYELMNGMYIFGLVVGLATVGAWLYFCSAYTGHIYHRQRVFRRFAVGLYVTIITVKITNRYHGLYFRSTIASEPFPHLTIQLMPVHWIVTGLSYVLTGIGFYMLYELFSESDLDTRALSLLVVITGLPAILDILSYTGNFFLTLNYEPVGVAVFSVGTLYVVNEQFVSLPAFWRQDVIETLDDPVLVFGRNGTIRGYNTAATNYFPKIEQATNQPLNAVYPALLTATETEIDLIETEVDGATRYFTVERETLSIEHKTFGQVVILSDITETEQQRRKLQQQNAQLGDLAVTITHELRNSLTVIRAHFETPSSEVGRDGQNIFGESHQRGIDALERVEQVTTDLAKMARYGQTAQSVTKCELREVVNKGWEATETDGLSLSVAGIGVIHGDKTRLIDLFCNALRFFEAIDAAVISVSISESEIVIESDGNSLSEEEVKAAFTYGEAVPSPESNIYLPLVRAIGRAHGWAIDIEQSGPGTVSLRILTANQRPQ